MSTRKKYTTYRHNSFLYALGMLHSFFSFHADFACQNCLLWCAETKGKANFQEHRHYLRLTYCILQSPKTKSCRHQYFKI